MLRPLLFVYGRECYRRNTSLVLFNFFKNIILVFPQFWMSIYNAFSGMTFYDQYLFQLFNVFYTSTPIIIFSVFDEQYPRSILYENRDNIYSIGLRSSNTKLIIQRNDSQQPSFGHGSLKQPFTLLFFRFSRIHNKNISFYSLDGMTT